MLFLGDVVDRGKRQLACLVLVVSALVLHPDTIFYLSGNHEAEEQNEKYGFHDELRCDGYSGLLYLAILNFFKSLPVAAVVDKRILAMHGGLGPEITAEDIRNGFEPRDGLKYWMIQGIQWSDPNFKVKSYEPNKSRGAGWRYGVAAIEEARRKFGIQFIVRAHQEMNVGVRFFGDWLISLNTSGWRSQRSNQSEYSKQRRRICLEDDEGPRSEISGVLNYDGGETFTMIHFVPFQKPYKSHVDFAKDFTSKVALEGAFSESNYDSVASPFIRTSKVRDMGDDQTVRARARRAPEKGSEEKLDRTQEDPTDADAKP
ncbi:unnamed protein product, partial [Mesorhabditis spiculigera]